MLYANGNYFEGDWVAGKREGTGRMRWNVTGETYTGEWLGDKQNGIGEQTWLLDNLGQYPFFYSNRYIKLLLS
jgi:hypothetical protein